MIAACPKCQAKYRVDTERLGADGARLRCAKCQAVFRVRPPAGPAPGAPSPAPAPPASAAPAPPQRPPATTAPPAPEPAPPAPESVDRDRLVLVADPDVETGKAVIGVLAGWGLQPVLVHDGVEAMLTIQRMLPRAVVLDAALPKMYGFQICEIIKRNESLRSIHVVLVGAIHHRDRYRRPPSELYGADVYLEKPQLPTGLREHLQRFGYPLQAAAAPAPPAAAPEPPPAAMPPAPEPPPPAMPAAPEPPPAMPSEPSSPPPPAPVAAPAPPAAAPAPSAHVGDGLDQERANAERLARIIVSDILLYHPEQFEAGLRSGQLAEALDGPIEEGRGFFSQRVDPRVRDERDYLMEELLRVARQRAGQ